MESFFIKILGFIFIFFILICGCIINNLRKIRFKKGDAALRAPEEFPAYLKDLFQEYESQLFSLGFEFSIAN